MSESLENILKGCLKRDYKYQKLLYGKYASLFYAICLRYLKNTDDARDALQDGFMKIYNGITKFSGEGSFEGWMKKVMVNQCLSQLRENKKMIKVDLDLSNEAVEEEEEDMVFPPEYLFKLVQELPVGYRTVFNLYVLDGFTHKDIAENLGISEGTSKSQLARAKKMLREQLVLITNGR